MLVILYSRTQSIWLSATAERDPRDSTMAIVTRGDTTKRVRRRDLVEGFPSLAAAAEAAEMVRAVETKARAMRRAIRAVYGIK